MENIPIFDTLNRPLRDLRISVTDRCNFRCPYCMPAEIFGDRYEFLPKADLLTFEEITRIVNIAVGLGVTKVRITGGEPLVRQNIEELVGMISAVDGVEDLAMPTNAYLLSGYAQKLKDAGLQRITVSLDSLEDDILQKMNGRGFSTARVLDGIKVAEEAGLQPIKINAVVQKGVNDHTVVGLAEWCRTNGHTPRFIEYMDVGTLNDWKLEQVVSANEIVELIRQKFPAEPVGSTYPGEVAKRYHYKDGQGEFGVISSVSQPFCGDCSRMRLSSEGKVVTCLFAESGTDLRKGLRNGSTDDEIKDTIIGIWGRREDRYSEERSEETVKRKKVEMYHIGG